MFAPLQIHQQQLESSPRKELISHGREGLLVYHTLSTFSMLAAECVCFYYL